MTRTRSLFAMAAAVGVALAALGGAPVAHARGDVTWSVGVGVPGVVVGATNGYPAYVAPPPVYYAPPPRVVYTPPQPVYYTPPPPPVVYGPGYGYYNRGHRHHHHHGHGHGHGHGGGRHRD